MSFIRTKTINGNEYAYGVKSIRTDDGVRQEVLEYLGRADKIDSDSDGLVDASDCDPDDPTEKGEKHRMVEKETENRVKDIFSRAKEKLEVDPELELEIIKLRPIFDENVYGEAYPDEKKSNWMCIRKRVRKS